ncbi:flagellar motor switch protein FliN [Naasia lichenicola]|uniref:Flagellar motor switch protein FliN n=2 Tax=Naasia lichenicola TaxID=2565933 RepID=A0A4S4FLL2_9MICO|nr:flagellar motor switch protein FliN [Naasia lichenicola]
MAPGAGAYGSPHSAGPNSTEARIADILVQHLPGRALMANPHVGGPIPADALALAVSATYVGSRSADLGVILLDREELLEAAGGDASRVRVGDVLRPSFEAATSLIGGGMLGETSEASAATLFGSPDTTIFDLVGEQGVAGWFAIALRAAPGRPAAADPTLPSRLGRISNVEMTLTVEIGRTTMSVRDLLSVTPGTVIELDRSVGSTADVHLNGRLIAHGEIVVVDQVFAVRITQVLDSIDEG